MDLKKLENKINIIQNKFRIGKFDEVINDTKLLLKKFDDQQILYNILSLAYQKKGENDKSIEKIVIGLPITLNNTFSDQTKKVQDFAEKLETKIEIPLIQYDERLSSIEAKKSLINQGIKTGHNKEFIDMTSAAIFLQSYLDEKSSIK